MQNRGKQHRDHYLALDGLRGIAAISVLFFHLGHWQQQAMVATNAGLWVDFFFTLSGYVMALAYAAKLDAGMSLRKFVEMRLIRLLPLIILATFISAAYLFTRRLVLHDANIDLYEVVAATAFGLLCLPMFTASSAIGGPEIFPLNGPQYTLFLELVANFTWAAVRPSRKFSGALTIMLLGYLVTAIYGMGGDKIDNFWAGFPKVFSAYYAGVVIFHAQLRWKLFDKHSWGILFWPLLALTLSMSWWPDPAPYWMGWSWSFLMPPLLVISGSKVKLTGIAKIGATVLGELSYPVYALHYAIFVWINGSYQFMLHRKDFVIGTLLVVPLVLSGSWLLLKLVDRPIRARLSSQLGRRNPPLI
jgi:peptidoglycan/LPS O-acetylase OafA/YrhL